MSHTTYGYTRDRLGFEPDREEPRLTHYAGVQTYQTNGHSRATTNGRTERHHADHQEQFGGVYEENLSKFKGKLWMAWSRSSCLGIGSVARSGQGNGSKKSERKKELCLCSL